MNKKTDVTSDRIDLGALLKAYSRPLNRTLSTGQFRVDTDGTLLGPYVIEAKISETATSTNAGVCAQTVMSTND